MLEGDCCVTEYVEETPSSCGIMSSSISEGCGGGNTKSGRDGRGTMQTGDFNGEGIEITGVLSDMSKIASAKFDDKLEVVSITHWSAKTSDEHDESTTIRWSVADSEGVPVTEEMAEVIMLVVVVTVSRVLVVLLLTVLIVERSVAKGSGRRAVGAVMVAVEDVTGGITVGLGETPVQVVETTGWRLRLLEIQYMAEFSGDHLVRSTSGFTILGLLLLTRYRSSLPL